MPRLPGSLLALLLVTACATARTERTAYSTRDVDTPPKLLGCPQYPEDGPSGRVRTNSIDVTVTVDARGAVRSVSVPAYLHDPQRENELRIRQAALSCRYEPGLRGGTAVPVRGVRLRVNYPRLIRTRPEQP